MKHKAIILTIVLLLNSVGLIFSQEFSFLMEITEFEKGATDANEKNIIYYGMKEDMVVLQPLSEDNADTRTIKKKPSSLSCAICQTIYGSRKIYSEIINNGIKRPTKIMDASITYW